MNYQLFEKMYPTASETGTTPRSTTARSKLRLEKEPLRTLSGSELGSVGGGLDTSPIMSIVVSAIMHTK